MNTGGLGWRVSRIVLGMFLLLHLPAGLAWGVLGHRVVAELAWEQLSPTARAAASRLLALEPGATLASVANWADVNRDDATRSWHFVNFSAGTCSYEPSRDCPDGQCVVAATAQQLAVLASDASDAQKLIALKYVVHLVADLHQPLHAGHADDRGGNRYQLQAFGSGTNLHALWDSGLLRERGDSTKLLVHMLKMLPDAALAQDLDLTHAARESCQIVDMPGFYPPHNLPDNYAVRFNPILDRQLALAGARLAGLLNRLWQ